MTISGLAERLGISKTSVSYALNGRPGVSGGTRARVLALAAELGWYPNSNARALSHSRSDVVGIVLAWTPQEVGQDSYYMQVLAGIESVLGGHDVNLMLRMVTSDPPPALRRDLDVYRRWSGERRVDGVVVLDRVQDDPRLPLLASLRLPYVLVGSAAAADRTQFGANATADQVVDAGTLVKALHRLGHQRIAYVSGPLDLAHERARRSGLLTHASRLGMSVVFSASDYSADNGGKAACAVVSGLEPRSPDFPTAIIFANDLMAMGGLRALKWHGLEVPGQLSVLSWEDSVLCQLGSPRVTALARDAMEMGRRAAAALLAMIAGHETVNVAMPPGVLNVRESLAEAPTRHP